MTPDIINGLFEVLGGIFISLSILKLHRDKTVMGVSWLMIAFFAVWGWWNLYFYPSLGQWWSFYGGIGVVTANTIYLGQLIYYSRQKPKWSAQDHWGHYGTIELMRREGDL